MSLLEPPQLASFEPVDGEDRPPPPSVSEYPIGCEVELVDVGAAKIAQTEELWEPFMDQLFAQGRRTVRVVRHQGDYTFVSFDEGDVQIGCTLYRACLGDAKIKFKEQIPSFSCNVPPVLAGRSNKADGDALFELYTSGNEEDKRGQRNSVGFSGCGSPKAGGCSEGQAISGSDMFVERPVNPDAGESAGGAVVHQQQTPAAFRKYQIAMWKGYEMIQKEQFREALKYYTVALRYSTDGGARALSNRSAAFLGMNDPESAYADALMVTEVAPKWADGYIRLGNTLRGMKQYKKAHSMYEKALSLDSGNVTIPYLLESNYMAMLYATKLVNKRMVALSLEKATMSAILTTRKDIFPCLFSWAETATTITLLEPIAASTTSKPSRICDECYRPLTQAEEFAASLPGVQVDVLDSLFAPSQRVHCSAECGSAYCSESCRAKAWYAHHSVECPVRGKWGNAFHGMRSIFNAFADEYNAHTYKTGVAKGSCANASRCSGGEGAIVQTRVCASQYGAAAIIACVRLACRMLVEMVCSKFPLEDSVCIFKWLLPAESDHSPGLPQNEQEGLPSLILNKLLMPVFAALEPHFTLEEKKLLTFGVFYRCYERARYNCIRLRISLWPHIQRKAHQCLALPHAGDSVCSGASSNTSMWNSLPFISGEAQAQQLRNIISTPTESMPGYFECLAVFRVFSVAFAPKRNEMNFNLRLRTDVESSAVIRVQLLSEAKKGTRILVDHANTAFFAESLK
ncbi:putative Tetratricopeptide repeat [Trypanosoma vivax]|nr:putative Tetratricopeptide repeat [Trypanosoma vivax]